MHLAGWLVALVGSPNGGKTAPFDRLAGGRQIVANDAGLTVERRGGRDLTAEGKNVHALDLPGADTLHPRSPDERVTGDVLAGQAAV